LGWPGRRLYSQRVTDGEGLLRAYDEQMRGIGTGRPGLVIERDGPVLRVAGEKFRVNRRRGADSHAGNSQTAV
jgi:hypothetical protein